MIQSADPQETVAVGLCHLDEDVVGTIAASNDVSISFSCEGSFLGTCDLIKKGVPLPFEKKDTLEGTINGLFIYHGRWNVEYSVITDNKNVVVKSQIVPSTGVIITILKSILALLGVAIFDIPIGIIIHAEYCKSVPLRASSYKNNPILSPIAMKTGTIINETKIANISEDLTLFSMCSLSFFTSAIEMSGTSAVASEPMRADGKNKRGKVIPRATP